MRKSWKNVHYETVDLVNEYYERAKKRSLELCQMMDVFLDEDEQKMRRGPKHALLIDKVHRHEGSKGEWVKLEELLSEFHACRKMVYEMEELKREIRALGE